MDKNEIIETLRANRTLLEQFHVRSLAVFGSIVRGEAGPERDVDILVEFDPGPKVGLFAFARLQRCLQDLLGRQVDLTTPKALHKALKKNLSQEELLKLPVYIAHRPQKDPRDLRVLDPACGSGRFLLYAFEEYWDDQAVAAASRRCSRIGASEIQSRDDSATIHFFNQDEPIANL
nr:nucleotidyltransferase domain-containing protein [Desulfobacterales bacterium]